MRHSVSRTSKAALLIVAPLLSGCTFNVSLGPDVGTALSAPFNLSSAEPASVITPMLALGVPVEETTGSDLGGVLIEVATGLAQTWLGNKGLNL